MHEIFERLLAENGVKAYDVAKATCVRQSTLSEWKKAFISENRKKKEACRLLRCHSCVFGR